MGKISAGLLMYGRRGDTVEGKSPKYIAGQADTVGHESSALDNARLVALGSKCDIGTRYNPMEVKMRWPQ
jgi:hypothetical protein